MALGFRAEGSRRDKVVSKKRGPQYRPQHTIVVIMGTPKKVPLILGNRHKEPQDLLVT